MLVLMLYDDLFIRLERARWTLNADIPFDDIDPSLLSPQWISDLRNICLTELSALYATEMFLRDFYTDIDFCSFISIWFYEEMKHHLTLRKYLERCGETFDETKLPELRLTFAPGPAIETLTMHFCGEQRLAHWYTAFSEQGPEPVMRKIFKILAADELRHAACYAKYMRRAVANKPECLPDILKMSLWMMRSTNDAPKHPTTITEPSVIDQLEDPTYIVADAQLVSPRARPRGTRAAPDHGAALRVEWCGAEEPARDPAAGSQADRRQPAVPGGRLTR